MVGLSPTKKNPNQWDPAMKHVLPAVRCVDVLTLALLILLRTTPAAAASSYSIGNSLTWDSQPDGIAAMAASQGLTLVDGYHILVSEPLVYIEQNPGDVTLTNGFGAFNSALPGNAWSFVSIEPFPDYSGGTSTMASDLSSISALIALTQTGPSQNALFYIYAAWPPIPCWCFPAEPGDTYDSWWDQPSTNVPTTQTLLVSQYFSNLYGNAVKGNPNASVLMIPVGEVLAQIDQDIIAGQFPAFASIFDLYRDDYHLSFDVGRFVAAATVYATYFHRSPVGVPVPTGFFTVDGTASGAPGLLTTDTTLRDQLEQVVWDVVSSDSRTGVAQPPPLTVSSTTVSPGEVATFTVTPIGSGTFTYQWYQGTSGDTSTPVGNGAATFTTPPLTEGATYWVQITNNIGLVENSSSISVALTTPVSANGPMPPWTLFALGSAILLLGSRRWSRDSVG